MREADGSQFEVEFVDAYRRIDRYPLARVREARVLVIGIGAIGNELVKNLALFDIGHLLLCDMDRVEWANLSHSVLFRKRDHGRSKVKAAAREVKALNSRTKVSPFDCSLHELGLGVWRRADVIAAGLDSRGARLLLDRICGRVGKDWVDAGLGAPTAGSSAEGLLQATVQTFSPSGGFGYEDCLSDNLVREDAEQELDKIISGRYHRQGCDYLHEQAVRKLRVPTTPAMASLVGALQAQEVIRRLSPGVWGDTGMGPRRVSVDASRMVMRVDQYTPRAAAPVTPVVEEAGLSARATTVGEMVARAKSDLGPETVVNLGFEYVLGFECSLCHRKERGPFRRSAKSVTCPHCSTPTRSVERRHLGSFMPNYLDGSEPFQGLPLYKLGVPLLDVLTAEVRHDRRAYAGSESVACRRYELTGDLPAVFG